MTAYKIQKKPFVVPTTDGKLIEEHFVQALVKIHRTLMKHLDLPKISFKELKHQHQ